MIKALDLVVPPPGTLLDRVSGQRDERVGLGGGRARIGRAPNEGLCPLRRFLVGETRRGRCLRSGESARGGGRSGGGGLRVVEVPGVDVRFAAEVSGGTGTGVGRAVLLERMGSLRGNGRVVELWRRGVDDSGGGGGLGRC